MITAQNLIVEFPIFENSHRSFKKSIINRSTGGRIGYDANQHAHIRALDDISFSFEKGSRIGLMGHNGSGKTTLLRVLAGIYSPIQGQLTVRGRVASLLDISMGLDHDATGFENIYLRGILGGLKPSEIRSKIDEIAEFTELGEFLNLPVRTYSSGMMLRLAFAISTSVDADILIMDEWLSVGDSSFNSKASQRMEALIGKSAILVIASHDQSLIDRVCNRKIQLENGKIILDTAIEKVFN